jgi:hypothetical protein
MVEEVLTVVLIGVVMLKQMFVISKEASGPRLHPRSDHATSTGVDSTAHGHLHIGSHCNKSATYVRAASLLLGHITKSCK